MATDGRPDQRAGSGGHDIIKRVATYAPGSVIPAALTLVTSMVFTRLFTADVYGLFSLALVTATMVKTAMSSWMKLSIAKFLPQEPNPVNRQQLKRAILLGALLMLLAEVVVGAIAVFLVTTIWQQDEGSLAGPALAWVLASSTFDVFCTVFAAEHRAKEYVSYQLFASVTTFCLRLILVFTVFQGRISVMFWSLVVAEGVLLPLLWLRAGLPSPRTLLRLPREPQTRRLSRAFLAFGLPMTLWLVASILMDVGDRFVIDALLGPSAVGIYDANYRLIAGVVALAIVPVSLTLYPYLMSVSASDNPEHVGLVIGVIVENLLLLGTLAVGITFLFQHELALLLGVEFRQGSVIMPVVLAGVFAFNVGSFVQKPYEIVGRTGVMVLFAYLAAGLNIALNFALIPLVGYLGAAYATLIAYLFYTVVVGRLGRRIYAWHLAAKALAARAAVVAGAVGAIFAMRAMLADHRWPGFALAVVASAVLCAWVLIVVRRGVLTVPKLETATK